MANRAHKASQAAFQFFTHVFDLQSSCSAAQNKHHRLEVHLEKIDGKRAAEHAVRHCGLHAGVDAGPHLHQLTNAPLEALPKFQNHALLAGRQFQALNHLQATVAGHLTTEAGFVMQFVSQTQAYRAALGTVYPCCADRVSFQLSDKQEGCCVSQVLSRLGQQGKGSTFCQNPSSGDPGFPSSRPRQHSFLKTLKFEIADLQNVQQYQLKMQRLITSSIHRGVRIVGVL